MNTLFGTSPDRDAIATISRVRTLYAQSKSEIDPLTPDQKVVLNQESWSILIGCKDSGAPGDESATASWCHDSWGRPVNFWPGTQGQQGADWSLQSLGADGIDNQGRGDDIVLSGANYTWRWMDLVNERAYWRLSHARAVRLLIAAGWFAILCILLGLSSRLWQASHWSMCIAGSLGIAAWIGFRSLEWRVGASGSAMERCLFGTVVFSVITAWMFRVYSLLTHETMVRIPTTNRLRRNNSKL